MNSREFARLFKSSVTSIYFVAYLFSCRNVNVRNAHAHDRVGQAGNGKWKASKKESVSEPLRQDIRDKDGDP